MRITKLTRVVPYHIASERTVAFVVVSLLHQDINTGNVVAHINTGNVVAHLKYGTDIYNFYFSIILLYISRWIYLY